MSNLLVENDIENREIFIENFFKDIDKEIYCEFESKISKCAKFDIHSSLQLIKDAAKDLLIHTENWDEENLLVPLLDETKKLKKMWTKREESNEKSAFHKEIAKMKSINNLIESKDFNIPSVEKYKEQITNKLHLWRDDNKSYLSDFLFIQHKRKDVLRRAIKIDIQRYIYNKLIMETKDSVITYEEMIDSLTNIAVDTTNKQKLIINNDTYRYENSNLIYSIDPEDLKGISIKNQSGKILEQVFKVLNETDIRIFRYLIKKRGPYFFQDGVINLYLDDICLNIFGANQTRYREYVISSLIRMSIMKVFFYSKDEEGGIRNIKKALTTSLLSDLVIDVNEGNKTKITVVIGYIYREEVINGNMVRVYSKLLENINDGDARVLMFYLQKQRLILYDNRDKNDISNSYTKMTLSYSQITSAILFATDRKARNIKRIEKAFNILVENNSIISSYLRRGDFFEVTFIPITQKEINDLEVSMFLNLNKNTKKLK